MVVKSFPHANALKNRFVLLVITLNLTYSYIQVLKDFITIERS